MANNKLILRSVNSNFPSPFQDITLGSVLSHVDLDNNQVTSGQTIWSLKYSADYAFSKNLTGIFYFDYAFSEYAISTAFPQTTIRSGLTLRYNFGN